MVGRAVHRPPYRAASSFLVWANDLWPYVNGKAISQGVDLSLLDAADFVDLLHYYFEIDANVSSGEQAEARDAMRAQIYGELYKTVYKYGGKSSKVNDFSALDDPYDDMPMPVDPMEKSFTTKPYVPPTMLDEGSSRPFGSVLDAPLG